MIQARVLICVRIRPGCIQISLVKQFTTTGLEVQFIMRQIASSDTWWRSAWSLPWRLGRSDVVLLHRDRIVSSGGRLVTIEIVQFAPIDSIVKVGEGLETVEPGVVVVQTRTVLLLRISLNSHRLLLVKSSHTSH